VSTPPRICLLAGISGWIALLACNALADSLVVGQRQWPNVKIQWVQDGKVRFTAADGSQQAVPIPTVTRLQVDLRDDLNRGEQLRAEGKTAEAMAAYEAALRIESRNDLGGFLRYRLMDLAGRSGQLDRAVEMFRDLVKQPDFHAVVKDWRPQNVAAVRPKVREAAIAELEDGLRQIKTGLASESVRELRDFIRAHAAAPAGAAAGEAPGPGGVEAPGPGGVESVGDVGAGTDSGPAGQMAQTAWPGLAALQRGRYDQALQAADQALAQEGLPRDTLAEALYVRGVALWHLAGDRSRALEAGWALARLLVEFPASPHVPECQYYLGLVHEKLGRTVQARLLLQQALNSAGASADVKERARKALSEMTEKG
jgi:tetratricopeptide (TPR) repeat protein